MAWPDVGQGCVAGDMVIGWAGTWLWAALDELFGAVVPGCRDLPIRPDSRQSPEMAHSVRMGSQNGAL